MRLWSLHPQYLDSKGLVALWREGLLAQKVLQGQTKGYRFHPQLTRFQKTSKPILFISEYLHSIVDEAQKRGYEFDRSKIAVGRTRRRLPVTRGQMRFEKQHLLSKLKQRDPERARNLPIRIASHPLFTVQGGLIEDWEKT